MREGKRTLRLIKICEIYCQVVESVVMFVSALHISQGGDTEIVVWAVQHTVFGALAYGGIKLNVI